MSTTYTVKVVYGVWVNTHADKIEEDVYPCVILTDQDGFPFVFIEESEVDGGYIGTDGLPCKPEWEATLTALKDGVLADFTTGCIGWQAVVWCY